MHDGAAAHAPAAAASTHARTRSSHTQASTGGGESDPRAERRRRREEARGAVRGEGGADAAVRCGDCEVQRHEQHEQQHGQHEQHRQQRGQHDQRGQHERQDQRGVAGARAAQVRAAPTSVAREFEHECEYGAAARTRKSARLEAAAAAVQAAAAAPRAAGWRDGAEEADVAHRRKRRMTAADRPREGPAPDRDK